MENLTKILIIYTGGTIGMVHDPSSGVLVPFNFDNIRRHVPELERFNCMIDSVTCDPLIDSSDVNPEAWEKMAGIIEQNYYEYDGFVILHGTDTMAFSASAISFMLENIEKPVIFTGSQLPIGMIRTDGRENLLSAVEIAASKHKNSPTVPEVCIYFENHLRRANRTTKFSAEHFNAFDSPDYPALAKTGINIQYNHKIIHKATVRKKFRAHKELDQSISILKLFPGINRETVHRFFKPPATKAVIMESYGTGNGPTESWYINELSDYVSKGGIVLNITQCHSGSVDMSLYETSRQLVKAGVTGGGNMTTEAAVGKLMYLMGKYDDAETVKSLLKKNLRGEITV